jgi:iron complex transport system substrate-binding protein
VTRPFIASALIALGAISLGASVTLFIRSPWLAGISTYGATLVEGGGFPKTLSTGEHRETLTAPPRRIASLTVAADEILISLVSPDRIVAVTHFADVPDIATCAGRVPSNALRIRGADPEPIIALQPDLVPVAHYTLESAVRMLGAARVPVVRMAKVRSFGDVEGNVMLLARATGTEERGRLLTQEMHETLAVIEKRLSGRARPRVLYYSAVGYTSGTGTLVDEKIRRAGGRNAAADAGLVGFKNVSLDVLVGLDPDVIVLPRWSPDGDAPIRELSRMPAFRDVRAVRAGRVFSLPASELTSESPEGTRGVESLARLLHPEVFAS